MAGQGRDILCLRFRNLLISRALVVRNIRRLRNVTFVGQFRTAPSLLSSAAVLGVSAISSSMISRRTLTACRRVQPNMRAH